MDFKIIGIDLEEFTAKARFYNYFDIGLLPLPVDELKAKLPHFEQAIEDLVSAVRTVSIQQGLDGRTNQEQLMQVCVAQHRGLTQKADNSFRQIKLAYESLNKLIPDEVAIVGLEGSVPDEEGSGNLTAGFIRDNMREGETYEVAKASLHRELSVLLTKKHTAPLNDVDLLRFKELTAGLGEA